MVVHFFALSSRSKVFTSQKLQNSERKYQVEKELQYPSGIRDSDGDCSDDVPNPKGSDTRITQTSKFPPQLESSGPLQTPRVVQPSSHPCGSMLVDDGYRRYPNFLHEFLGLVTGMTTGYSPFSMFSDDAFMQSVEQAAFAALDMSPPPGQSARGSFLKT